MTQTFDSPLPGVEEDCISLAAARAANSEVSLALAEAQMTLVNHP